jgi:ribosomal protein L25 (general stress protein Ctc)
MKQEKIPIKIYGRKELRDLYGVSHNYFNKVLKHLEIDTSGKRILQESEVTKICDYLGYTASASKN